MKNALHTLIHSLGKNEKRHFKLFAQPGNKKREHRLLLLFDILTATPPGEAIQIDRHDAGILRTDLPSAMYKLNQLLMKGLRVYHAGKTEASRMRAAMEDIELLFRKGLFAACQRSIQKARIRAHEHENYAVLLQLSDWDLQLMRAQPPADPILAMRQLNAQKRELIARIQEQEECLALYRMAFLVTQLRPTQMDDNSKALMQEILGAPILRPETPVNTLIGCLTKALIPGLLAFRQSDYEQAMTHFEAGRTIFDRQRFLINQHPDIYRVTLTNLLNACLFLGRQERYKVILDQLPDIRMESPTDKRRLQILVYYSDLLFCLNFGDKQRGTQLVSEIQNWIHKNLDVFETDVLFNFYYNSCLFHFMHGNYRQAIRLLNQILNSKRQDLRQDIYDYAHLFQLVIHWELQNTDLLEYQLQNVRRYLKVRHLDRAYEQRILAFFGVALETPDLADLRSAMVALRDFLGEVLTAPDKAAPLGCQELVFWLESKLAGMEIGEFYRAQLEGR